MCCDESGATGESDSIKKGSEDPFFLSGTKVLDVNTLMTSPINSDWIRDRGGC